MRLTGTAPSDNFVGQAGTMVYELRTEHPDERVRAWLSGEHVVVYGKPGPTELMLAGSRGQPLAPDDLLLALHVGTPQIAQSEHRIMLFEDSIRAAAQLRGVTVDEQIQESLLHELEHHGGFCPDGHTDCSAGEQDATVRAMSGVGAQVYLSCGCAH